MKLPQSTPEQWRLDYDEGDHKWRLLTKEKASKRPQTFQEQHLLGLNPTTPKLEPPKTFEEAAINGYAFYQKLQLDDGHWACAYGGPSFLLPGIIFALYITDTDISPEWKTEITRHLKSTINVDGGWGFHAAGPSSCFATGLNYVMLRLLGLEKDEELLENARECLLLLGGAAGMPQWGKLWLSLLNLYKWDGVNPIPAELWILPEWLPFHPWRMWVQCRVVYLPASYLSSNKFCKELNPLLKEIRDEIYTVPYAQVDFPANRWTVSHSDMKKKPSLLLVILNLLMIFWTSYIRPNWLLRRANRRIQELVRREDENTDYNCLAPVNKALQMVSVYFMDGSDSSRVQLHADKIIGYLWMGETGLTCSGTNGVQVWDTAFSVQAASEAGLAKRPEFKKSLQKAYQFLAFSQIPQNLPDPYRQQRAGGWPFSTRSNGYMVSDTTAESLKAVLLLHGEYWPTEINFSHDPDSPLSPPAHRITASRLENCVDSLLGLQNADGGFATYERKRAPEWIELLNPADVFDRIMVEYNYPECTAAALSALAAFSNIYPSYKYSKVRDAKKRAVKYLKSVQRADGGWYGSWAICFTYATYLVLVGLESVGENYQNSQTVQRACKFLLKKQRDDGGWGEHWTSCEVEDYVQHPEKSQVVMTAWATLALMAAKYPEEAPITRGLQLLMSRQQLTGEWLQEDIEGVFNRTCMIGYPNYKYYFPIWALGKYASSYQPWRSAQSSE